MEGTTRFVNIRGYVRKVVVLHANEVALKVNKDASYAILVKDVDANREQTVPAHLFYHHSAGGLIIRDSTEFKRRYPNHPINIIDVN